MALDNKAAGWLLSGGGNFQPSRTRKLSKLRYGALLAAQQHHLHHQMTGHVVG